MTIEEKRAYGRAYYAKTKHKYIDKNNKYRVENRKTIREIKNNTPCTDCGVSYPYYVMDFDHLRDKKYIIANSSLTPGMLKKEIEKCEVVCSNCHRERTHTRLVQQIE